MFDTIKDAAGRLRSHYDYMKASGATTEFDLFAHQLTGSPYYDADWKCIHGGRLREDEGLLAKAYLMENDKTLITREWLLNAGFEWDDYDCLVNGCIVVIESGVFKCRVGSYSFEPTIENVRLAAKLFKITLNEGGTPHAN